MDGIVKTTGRQFVEIPQIFEDFTLLWRDIEYSQATGYPMDLSSIIAAAQAIAYKEDKLIFFGNEFLGVKGLLNSGSKFKKSDWSKGEMHLLMWQKGFHLLEAMVSLEDTPDSKS